MSVSEGRGQLVWVAANVPAATLLRPFTHGTLKEL